MKNYSKKVRNDSPFASGQTGFRSQPRSWVDFECYALFFLETQTEKEKNQTSDIFVVLELCSSSYVVKYFSKQSLSYACLNLFNKNGKRLSHE